MYPLKTVMRIHSFSRRDLTGKRPVRSAPAQSPLSTGGDCKRKGRELEDVVGKKSRVRGKESSDRIGRSSRA